MSDLNSVLTQNLPDGADIDAKFFADVRRSHEGIIHLKDLLDQGFSFGGFMRDTEKEVS